MNRAQKLVIGIIASISLPAFAATPIPPGKWSFVFTDAKGRADRPMRIYTFRPKACDASCPIWFVLHGTKRNASSYRDNWEFLADKYKLLVVAPEFPGNHWVKAAGYNQGDVTATEDREKWGFSVIEHLFDEVRTTQTEYRIFGHSAGGQFVQRMAIFRPDNRAAVMVAANPGWYTLPEWRKDKGADPFPYSLVNARGAGEAELRQALAKRLVLVVGGKDEEPDEENLGQTPSAKKQGDSRTDRGQNFVRSATSAAGDLGVQLGWQLIEVPDAAQDGYSLSRIAVETLYGRK